MLNIQKKELEDIYNKISDVNKSEGTLIYNELLFMLDTLEVLKTEIKQKGATEHFIQGKQNFLRESPSLSAYNKLMKTYDIFYKNLINLLQVKEQTDNNNDTNIDEISNEQHLQEFYNWYDDNFKILFNDYLEHTKQTLKDLDYISASDVETYALEIYNKKFKKNIADVLFLTSDIPLQDKYTLETLLKKYNIKEVL